jgi:hypothetical protein
MSATPTFREFRRSTRVPLKVGITVESGAERVTCEGETVVVNLHGALLSTTIGLNVGMRISIHVYLTDKRAKAAVSRGLQSALDLYSRLRGLQSGAHAESDRCSSGDVSPGLSVS